jgi:hypothetical protein
MRHSPTAIAKPLKHRMGADVEQKKRDKLTRSKLEVIEPVLGNDMALLEAFLVHSSDDGRV